MSWVRAKAKYVVGMVQLATIFSLKCMSCLFNQLSSVMQHQHSSDLLRTGPVISLITTILTIACNNSSENSILLFNTCPA